MNLPPQKLREIVLQMLFAQGFTGTLDEESAPFFMEEHKVPKSAALAAQKRAEAVAALIPVLDERIGPASTEFALHRIGRVEKGILRLAVYELLYDDEIPPKVSIAEAIRLCRKFGTRESAEFVNAVLDGIYKNLEPSLAQ